MTTICVKICISNLCFSFSVDYSYSGIKVSTHVLNFPKEHVHCYMCPNTSSVSDYKTCMKSFTTHELPPLAADCSSLWPSLCKKLSISYQSITVRVFDLLTLAFRLSVPSSVSYPKAGIAETGYEVSSFLALPFSFFFYPTCIDYLLQARYYALPSFTSINVIVCPWVTVKRRKRKWK